FQAEDGIRDCHVTGVQTCAPPILLLSWRGRRLARGDVQAVIDRVQRRVEPGRRREVTPHGLRHTTATHLLAAGTDMDAVRRVLEIGRASCREREDISVVDGLVRYK